MEKSEIKVNNFIKRYMRIYISIIFSASILLAFWHYFLREIILDLLLALFIEWIY